MRADSKAAWEKFQDRVAELGGRVVETAWLGRKRPHRVVCAAGHEVSPGPEGVIRGGGICRICSGKDKAAAWQLFCQLVTERGGHVLETEPLGVSKPHRIRCPEGHETVATPSYVRMGGGLCRVCSPNSTISAEGRFRDLVAALDGSILESTWLGTKTPHRVACGRGHETTVQPNALQQRGHLCRICSGHDSATSWQVFRDRVAELGGVVVEPEWLGNKKQHRVICKEGHECVVLPNNVQQGSSICRTCAYKTWDVFYVVANDAEQMVKFGITSHDARSRLRFHRNDGFGRVIKTITGVQDAYLLERTVLTLLRSQGIAPVRGREYYNLTVLPAILEVVDGWGSVAA